MMFSSFYRCSLNIVFLFLFKICKSQRWFVNLQEAAEQLAPRLEIILQHLMCAFGKYQVFFLAFAITKLFLMVQ